MFDWVLLGLFWILVLVLKFRPNWLGLKKITLDENKVKPTKNNESNKEKKDQTDHIINSLEYKNNIIKEVEKIGNYINILRGYPNLLGITGKQIDQLLMLTRDIKNSLTQEISYVSGIILDEVQNNIKIASTEMQNILENTDEEFYEENINQTLSSIITKLCPVTDILNAYSAAVNKHSVYVKNFYDSALSELEIELKKFRTLRGVYENSSTLKVYENAGKKYRWAFYIYLLLFLTGIYATVHFSLYMITEKLALKELGMDTYDYWTAKITGIFIFVTLTTFFLKQAIHYQKKKDETERTKLELEALPAYMADLTTEDAINLRKELASKYFGRENDKAPYADMSNIITDQLKLSNELLKTGLEASKVAQKSNSN